MTAISDFFANDPVPIAGHATGSDRAASSRPAQASVRPPGRPREPQAQLASHQTGHKAGATHGRSRERGEAPDMPQLNGHDIRMKEFRRALLRGYSRRDVDDFLTDVIASLDTAERTTAVPSEITPTKPAPPTSTPPPSTRPPAPPPAAEQGILVLKHAQRTADTMVEEAHTAAQAMRNEARRQAARIVDAADHEAGKVQTTAQQKAEQARREGHEAGQAELAVARSNAARGLQRARDRAQEILQSAGDREEHAARLEAESELRLAHVEQELADKAAAVTDQARRLDALASWLAGGDIRHEDPSAQGAVAAHAAPAIPLEGDVLEFKRG